MPLPVGAGIFQMSRVRFADESQGTSPEAPKSQVSQCLALVLPEDGHRAEAETVPDADAVQLRPAAITPHVRRITPRNVARHVEEKRGDEGVGHVLAVHLLDPLRTLNRVVNDREIRERRGLSLLDFLQHDAILPVPVRPEVNDLDDDPVGTELLRAGDGLHTVLVDVLREGFRPLAVLVAPSILRSLTRVEKSGGDGLAVNRYDDIEEGVARHFALVARDRAALCRGSECGVNVLGVDAGPLLDHRDLVRERGEPPVDETEGRLLTHKSEHETDDGGVTVELDHVFGSEAVGGEIALERFPDSFRECCKASHGASLLFLKSRGQTLLPADAEMMQTIG